MEKSSIKVVLYQPEIPQNTGNIARTCAATGTELHLIEPLGFSLKERHLRRAGLDYWNQVKLFVHRDWESFLREIAPMRCVVVSRKGAKRYDTFQYSTGDALIFGSETKGCPEEFFELYESVFIPMRPNSVRCLNLSTSVGIVLYCALSLLGEI